MKERIKRPLQNIGPRFGAVVEGMRRRFKDATGTVWIDVDSIGKNGKKETKKPRTKRTNKPRKRSKTV